jgi:hypothetical protein
MIMRFATQHIIFYFATYKIFIPESWLASSDKQKYIGQLKKGFQSVNRNTNLVLFAIKVPRYMCKINASLDIQRQITQNFGMDVGVLHH